MIAAILAAGAFLCALDWWTHPPTTPDADTVSRFTRARHATARTVDRVITYAGGDQ